MEQATDGENLVILLPQSNPINAPRPILTSQPGDFPLGGLVPGTHPDIDEIYGEGDGWKVLYLTSNSDHVNLFKALTALDGVVDAETGLSCILASMLADAVRLGNPVNRKKRR